VSESIDAEDLIVPSTATDLMNSPRITHRIQMKRSVLKRMQIVGAYREFDDDLPTPDETSKDAVQEEKANQQGVKLSEWDATRRDYTIYECYCELDIKGFEHKIKGEESGPRSPVSRDHRDVVAPHPVDRRATTTKRRPNCRCVGARPSSNTRSSPASDSTTSASATSSATRRPRHRGVA
jgi:hypothetical protein